MRQMKTVSAPKRQDNTIQIVLPTVGRGHQVNRVNNYGHRHNKRMKTRQAQKSFTFSEGS